MPPRRKKKKGKSKPDPILLRMKELALSYEHKIATQHLMRVPVLKMFCVVFGELAVCVKWTKRQTELKGVHDIHMRWFHSLCRDAHLQLETTHTFFSECRRLYHRMMGLDVERDDGKTHALWVQLRELGTMHLSVKMVNAGLVLAMGLHPRIGAGSYVQGLDADVVKMILGMLNPLGTVLWVDALYAT
jgi:hypothetical protein